MDTLRRYTKKRSPAKVAPRSLAKREKILNNADIIARINHAGAARKFAVHARNMMNEADRVATHARAAGVPAIARSLREGEAMFAEDFREMLRRAQRVPAE